MANRAYGQYCGLARAVEILGERWGLLIVRDLLVGPKRFTDLQRGLPGIPSNVLTSRLKELEAANVVTRRVLPRPARSIVYELTEYGKELEDAVIRFGRWGAKSLGEPHPGEIVTPDSMAMALRSTFRPDAAGGVSAGYELRLGDVVVSARVHDGTVEAAAAPLPGADCVIEAGPGIRAVMAGEMTPKEAIENGVVRVSGKRRLFDRFAEMFRI
ncbi:MAG TPA: helix-turn-helix domain-containing protein [Candidatus Cybelea sp.]